VRRGQAIAHSLRPTLAAIMNRTLDAITFHTFDLTRELAGPLNPEGSTFGWVRPQDDEVALTIHPDGLILRGEFTRLGQLCDDNSDCACTPGEEDWCDSDDMICALDSGFCQRPAAAGGTP
jgi:hypothetical protein